MEQARANGDDVQLATNGGGIFFKADRSCRTPGTADFHWFCTNMNDDQIIGRSMRDTVAEIMAGVLESRGEGRREENRLAVLEQMSEHPTLAVLGFSGLSAFAALCPATSDASSYELTMVWIDEKARNKKFEQGFFQAIVRLMQGLDAETTVFCMTKNGDIGAMLAESGCVKVKNRLWAYPEAGPYVCKNCTLVRSADKPHCRFRGSSCRMYLLPSAKKQTAH